MVHAGLFVFGGVVAVGIGFCLYIYIKRKYYTIKYEEISDSSDEDEDKEVKSESNKSVRKRDVLNDKICYKCKGESKFVCMPCNHKCLCEACAKILKTERNKLCPYCNAPVKETLAVWVTQKQEEMRKKMANGECLVCSIGSTTHTCLPCGHKCICINCAENILHTKGSSKVCPFCDEVFHSLAVMF